jgi:hypothetical protein
LADFKLGILQSRTDFRVLYARSRKNASSNPANGQQRAQRRAQSASINRISQMLNIILKILLNIMEGSLDLAPDEMRSLAYAARNKFSGEISIRASATDVERCCHFIAVGSEGDTFPVGAG